MARAGLPIQQIKENGRRGADLHRHRQTSVFARVKMFLLLPQVMHGLNESVRGDRLGSLDRDQTASLYRILAPFYSNLSLWVTSFDSAPPLVKLLFGWWMRRMETEAEEMGEIVETLAWGSDQTLHSELDSAITAIDSLARETAESAA